LYPETESSKTAEKITLEVKPTTVNGIEAAAMGRWMG